MSPLKIYVDRLSLEEVETISEQLPASFLSIEEKDLHFPSSVAISGKAYLANQHLIVSLSMETKAEVPCSICNEVASAPLNIQNFTLTVELSDIPSAVYDYTEEVRSALLLKLPQFLECNEGQCPQRKEVKKYLKNTQSDTYSPFSDLDL